MATVGGMESVYICEYMCNLYIFVCILCIFCVSEIKD